MAKIVIFGDGITAKLAHYYFTRDSDHEVVAFTVDASYREADTFLDLPLLDFEQVVEHYPPRSYEMFVALGYSKLNRVRAEKFFRAEELGYELLSYVSTKCTFLTDYPVGKNCFVLEDNTIQPFAKIGNNVTLWSGNHIGHDVVIEDHCFITSHVVIAGYVHVHPYCFIGVNATLRDGIAIAPETLLGGGAVIMKDTCEQGVYLPACAELIHKKSHEVTI